MAIPNISQRLMCILATYLMNLLTVENISKTYTDKILLDNVSLGINKGDKFGIIGVNGTGKSTFLKIIAGKEYTDSGIIIKGNKVKIAYLPQNPEFDKNQSILEYVLEGIDSSTESWNAEGTAKLMLNKLGFSDYLLKINILSGGQKKRVALIKTLMSKSEILILDEPTNHLDNYMIEWLEDYLKKYNGSILMVTHDRYFLDKVTNKIIELDKGKLYIYEANYSKFLELKSEREEMLLAAERKNNSIYRNELEWIKRGAKARSTKQKARIERFESLKNREKIKEQQNVSINSVSSRLGKKTLEVNNISKSYNDKIIFKDFNYIFLKYDRIGIIGGNGAGKSTLLKVITKTIKPDSGSVDIGDTVKIGYFSQENEYMNENMKVIDYIKEGAEFIQTIDGIISASAMLERFLFIGAIQYSNISKLSGGEKRRLYLLRVLIEAPNILILDEPTNDLDIQTLTILEDYLQNFDGIVITVSHDRYFLDKVVDRIFAFEGNGIIKQYEGNYSDYKEKISFNEPFQSDLYTQENKVNKKKLYKTKTRIRDEKLKFTYNEQKEFDTIDEIIADLEAQIENVQKEILKCSTDFVKLNDLIIKKEELEKNLDEKMDRWIYLNDLAEKIENSKLNN